MALKAILFSLLYSDFMLVEVTGLSGRSFPE